VKERENFICQTNITQYSTITKTQWQAAREAEYACQAGRPYSSITSVTQNIKREKKKHTKT